MNKTLVVRIASLPLVLLLVLLSTRTASAAAATDLRIRATAGSHRVGAIATYTVSVTNLGPAATDAPIHVLDTLPAGLTFANVVGTDWTCTASGQSVDCVRSTPLDSGRSSSFRFRVSVCTAAYPSVTNTFVLQYPGDTNGANNTITRTKAVRAGSCTPLPTSPPTSTPRPGTPGTATLAPTPTSTPTSVPVAADLQLTKTTASTFTVGGQGVYNLSVLNLGPGTTNGTITVVDALPTGLTFLSRNGSGWTCSASGQTVTCTTSNVVAAGGGTSFTLTVAVGSAAYPTVTNFASVSYAGDTNAANNTAQKPTTIRQ